MTLSQLLLCHFKVLVHFNKESFCFKYIGKPLFQNNINQHVCIGGEKPVFSVCHKVGCNAKPPVISTSNTSLIIVFEGKLFLTV